ncbi:LUD domain-containing protein [Nakamurella flavida]|uniref:LUD domain-containing protein n=1 Tax=Nakamurella flavida TaxID=363630 RepID=A0A938YL52_9ACTN|nr:LUD domain-containing protein [Nakamurella flavida]MBM9476546.1 LUD domain-containing protein [Nakamurella flavida]MDP9779016.1 L-lactate dehydrogenase complex protein LldG [Nakamurella flavida]
MTGSREAVLGRIRAALATAGPVAAQPVPREYDRRGALAPGSPEAIELLVDRLIDYRAEVQVVAPAEVTAAVARALGDAASVVVPRGLPDDVLAACEQDGRQVVGDLSEIPLTAAQLDGIDAVVTGARVAIALSGTIVLDGGPDQGRRAITLVPDLHVIVLRADQVVQTVPEAIALLDPTAPLTMISGPSATSDIELQRVEGVHGPRTLRVVIVG